MRSRYLRFMTSGLAIVAIAGCGQKGALYLPDHNGEVVSPPAAAAAPAPAAPASGSTATTAPVSPQSAPSDPNSKDKDPQPK